MLKLKHGFAALIWPIVVLLIALSAFYLKPWQTKPQETISVVATGKAEAIPNIAKITATVESKNPNLDQARQENSRQISTIITKLSAIGIQNKDIKTQNISAGPAYEIQIYPPQKPTTNQVSTSLEITIRDFNKTDQVLTTLTQNGATNLYGPSLTVDDATLESAKSKARENAVENAKAKAQQLANASARKLDKVIKIQEQGDFGIPVPMMAQSSADLQQKVSQIQPGQNEVTINISIDFSLK